ncbi:MULTISPECIES: response regulator [unclassified Brevundimonas]|uniref:response regulator n=1 Tax=unclassified Brevundimonas TaxID=2622653 RepID=UPI0025BE2FF4|nr:MULTISPECIES: response regulator [unclassified Brevundimonas]
MFALDTKSMQKIAPVVRRVVIVDPNPAGAKLMADLLKGFGCRDAAIEADEARVIDLAREMEPGLFILERKGPRLDGEHLARRIRRSSLSSRRAPIIMVTADATASSIKGARDAGIHEFLRKPFTSGDLYRRIENLATKPRDWVEAVGYVGPDRRRFNSTDYAGPRKRKADNDSAPSFDSIRDQAMRILASALTQFSNDPAQAVRAIREQARTLKGLAVKTGDTNLALAAVGLEAELDLGRNSLGQLMGPVKAVLALAPDLGVSRAG